MESEQQGTLSFSRVQLFELTQDRTDCCLTNDDANSNMLSYIINRANLEDCSEDIKKKVRVVVSRFMGELRKKWESSSRTKERFLRNNDDWLKNDLKFPAEVFNAMPSTSITEPELPEVAGPSRGRPEKGFVDASEKTKKRKTKHLVEEVGEQELAYAAQAALRGRGKRNAAAIVKEATQTTPKRATKIKHAYRLSLELNKPVAYNGDEALALIVDSKLTKHQYLSIREQAKERKADIYPSYHVIREAKAFCYPAKESISVTDSSAEIQLQALLNHTVSRIVTSQKIVLDQINSKQLQSLFLVSKWGCDGSTGQSEYKQTFSDDTSHSDKDLFVTCLVPLQLYSSCNPSTNKTDRIILWQNPRPSSTRYCRPIRFQFSKESTEITRAESEYIETQIKHLSPTKVSIDDDKEILVDHKLVMTMVDGKVCNAVTHNDSAQVCYICGASPKEMNNLDKVYEKVADPSTFSFGLSSLHAWIRFFECCIHIAYRLDIKKWQARGSENQEKVKKRKKEIIDRFRTEMGLLVDQPKAGGSGTSNDGNTARRFFQKPAISSEITGVDQKLIERFAVILQTIASGFDINPEAFDEYAKDTAKLYVHLYPWYFMPASVHKILVHGSEVISSSILPIGQFSEEAQEARNKDMKRIRVCHTRKSSRKNTNEDLLHLLLISSDPVISSVRPLPRKVSGPLSQAVLKLLAQPEFSSAETEHDSNSSYENSDDE